jgi:hypothetical protein
MQSGLLCDHGGRTLNIEAIAQKFAHARADYELVSYGEVGLPFYRIAINAHVLEHKPIEPFAEFALRSISSGVTEPDEIGNLLGLEEAVIDATLASLVEGDSLALRPGDGGGTVVALTPKGRVTLDSAVEIVPEDAVIEIDYDGLLRRPVPYIDRWLAPVELKNLGIREIPPSPTRPPEVRDIDISGVESMIRILGDRRQAKRDLLAFRSLERKRRFQTAVALVYRGDDPTDIQVAFAIDGILSPAHEDAFARSRYKRKLIGGDAVAPAEAIVEGVLGKELVESARRADRVIHADVSPEPGTDPLAETEVRPPELDDTSAVSGDPVRMLETFEHPAFLQEALVGATDRLVIVSPWVRRSIVDKKFIRQLEERLEAGVDVFVGWGITPPSELDIDIDSQVLKEFERLTQRFKFTFAYRRLGNTHAKVLICDRRFLIITSFNWLSFKGDPKRTFRDERGTLVALPDMIDEQFESWSRLIRTPQTNSAAG